MKEKTISEKVIYKGRILDLIVKEVLMPNGRKAIRETIDHGEVIVVAPILANGKVVLVRQFRKAAEKITLELPAGRMDPGEKPPQAVKRELLEETGYDAKRLKKLFSFYPAIGYSTEIIHFFIAKDLTLKTPDPDEDEFIEVITLNRQQALKKIGKEIIDGKSILGLLYLAQYHLV